MDYVLFFCFLIFSPLALFGSFILNSEAFFGNEAAEAQRSSCQRAWAAALHGPIRERLSCVRTLTLGARSSVASARHSAVALALARTVDCLADALLPPRPI